MKSNIGVCVLVTLLVCCIAGSATGSAIPMWEFLSRDEKMSHLYRVFSKQVARYCISSSRPDCNKNLLVSGVRSLANMDDNLLDKLDPYQHGATEMIWRAMVGTHRFSSRVGYETEDPYYTSGSDSLATSDSDTNGLTEDSGNDYSHQSSKHTGPYLVGPMVIRVYPDGRPVPEDTTRPLPKDEDAEELKYVRLPSIEELEANNHAALYGKSSRVIPKRAYLTNNQKDQRRTILPLRETIRRRVNPIPYDRRRFARISSDDAIRYY